MSAPGRNPGAGVGEDKSVVVGAEVGDIGNGSVPGGDVQQAEDGVAGARAVLAKIIKSVG